MNTEVLPAGDPDALRRGIELLARGELVAFPTDTVYGVGADAFRPEAVAKLFAAKIRPADRPIALLVAPEYDLALVAREVPPEAKALARRFWPGGLTLVLWRSPAVPDVVTAGGPTVGVRVPAHPVALALIRGLGAPLAATSANLSGQPSPLTAQEVARQLGGRIPLIIDGGRCPGGVESTVLDLTTPTPVIRRRGAIPKEAIEAVLGKKIAG